MKDSTSCPELSMLSQWLDAEVGEEEGKELREHVKGCSECQAGVRSLAQAQARLRTELTQLSERLSLGVSLPECLSPEVLSAYVAQVLSREEGEKVENHLQGCDRCLREVMEAVKISSFLATAGREAVPEGLKAKVAELWQSPPQEDNPSLLRLVIQVAKSGLKLLEQHLAAPFVEVQELLTPMPAYRSEEEPSALNLRLKSGQTEIRATVVKEGEGVVVRLTLLDAGQEVIGGQRIFVRQEGRAIFSARTDRGGVVRTPHLEPGLYEVVCPGLEATFELELRP